jgi:hypothetical protein
MILYLSKPPFEIGARRIGCVDGEREWREQPFVIIREVTQTEWIAYVRAQTDGEWPSAAEIVGSRDGRFFEVATD